LQPGRRFDPTQHFLGYPSLRQETDDLLGLGRARDKGDVAGVGTKRMFQGLFIVLSLRGDDDVGLRGIFDLAGEKFFANKIGIRKILPTCLGSNDADPVADSFPELR
jgi:hypothetical protein